MFFQNIHYWPVVAAAIVSTVIGFLWYSPWIFGKVWMKQMGITDKEVEEYKKTAGAAAKVKMYVGPLGLSLVTAFIVAALFNSLVITTMGGILILGFSVWIGFSMPVAANNALFGKDTPVLFLINAGFQLVNLVLVSIIIGLWS